MNQAVQGFLTRAEGPPDIGAGNGPPWPKKDTRLYVDVGPNVVAGTKAQKYQMEGMDHWTVLYGGQLFIEVELRWQQK